ncbi:peptidylprolyl isomerase [Winogradskyella pacifica]|jgi:cyclophilin family peptidyl-prolyl cis-trans isomerase|uniref:peptidylprolyl isomerase n=1 Tax=Winogradskyella pacifica TaxID=664642 RepID=A0A3D9MZP6_9FLAO|nr:peptidylprolyl isomerase [Winogradskyella pacifica]REE24827.1 cyclophilin family peptidyl-prolyl cis-trans isomerase [Winogradskyella pacifica]
MIKQALTAFVALLVLSNTSCQERYPDLEEGIYAEFVTSKDTMVAKLFYEKAPVTVANFVALAEGNHPLVKEELKGKPFYDGLTFHRVMNNFMVQGGDPTATGTGDPGYKFEDELVAEYKHDKPGILSMANSGPNSNGSQFFITEKVTPWLDGYDENGVLRDCENPRVACHSVFGELVKGLNILDTISNVKVAPRTNKPLEDVIIKKLNIIRIGSAAKKFDAPKVFTEELPKIKERIAQAKLDAEKKAEEAKIEAKAKADAAKVAFLKKNDELKGRKIESPTGMAMIFTHESKGVTPKATDRVNIECAGYLENGELFWTTWKDVAEKNGKYDERTDKAGRYSSFDMPYNETAGLIAGFREAMLHMKIGDKARVFIPYYLGYGERGNPPVIPPSANLVFDIELASIKK